MLDLDFLSIFYIFLCCYLVTYIYDSLGFKKIAFLRKDRVDDEDPVFYIHVLFLSVISSFEELSVSFWVISLFFWIFLISMDILRYKENQKVSVILKNRLEYYLKPRFFGLFCLLAICFNTILSILG